jgi:hypothetical protein
MTPSVFDQQQLRYKHLLRELKENQRYKGWSPKRQNSIEFLTKEINNHENRNYKSKRD